MRKILLWLLLVASASAQNWMNVTASNIYGRGNTPLAAGKLTFIAVDSTGAPISYQAGGGGQVVTYPISCPVTNGALSGPQCLVANVSVSNPANFCYSVTISDAQGQVVLGGPTSGYQCVQPQTSNFWCASGTCNFDQYVPNLPAAVTALMPPPSALSLGGVYAASCALGLVQTGIDNTGRPVCGSAIGTGNVVGSGLTAGIPLLGAGGNNIAIDTAHLVALTGADISTANNVVGLNGKSLPALSSGYLNYNGTAWLLTNPFASPSFTGTVRFVGLGTGCVAVNSDVVALNPCGGGASTFQVNGTPLGSATTINYQNSPVFNGLTFNFSNPGGGGNIQLGASGTLANSGLQFSSTSVNGQACALGSTCTVPFQTNGTNNISQSGENRVTSTANAVGLTATPVNSASNQAKIEIGGLLTNAGLQNPFATVNGQTCTLGAACNVPFLTNGASNLSQSGLNFVTSTVNAVGLTATPANTSNQERLEIAGQLSNAGLQNPSTTVNGSTCTLGATCTPLSTGITPSGTNGTFWGVSGGVQQWLVPSGAGNVNGPGAATAGHFAFFNNGSGTLLADGGAPGPLATQATGSLTTGIAKITTSTGLISTAVPADFPTLNQSTTGNAATATQISTTGVNGTFWGVSGGVQGYFTPTGGGNLSGSGLTVGVPLIGAGTTNVQTDVMHVVARTGVDISTADQVTGLLGAPLPALTTGYPNYTGSAWAFTTPVVPSPQFQVGLYASAGSTGVVTGDANLTEGNGVLAYNGQLVTARTGYGNQAGCNVENNVFTDSQDCSDFMEISLGLRSGYIYARPEIINKNWVTVNFSPDWRISTGPINSTLCDDSTLPFTAWSITSNVLTVTGTNTFTAGARTQLNGTGTFLDGLYVIVIASGLTGAHWSANLAHANASGGSGTFTPNLNCTIVNAPIIFGGNANVTGTGAIVQNGNMSGGSLIMNGAGHPKPVGKPTLGTFTCGGSGGPGGTALHFAVQFDVNLQTNTTSPPTRGFGAYATQDVNCTAQGAPTATTVTINAPTGGVAGSLAHTEFSVGVATALNGDYYVQQTGANGSMTCGVAGTIDSLNDCKTSGNAVITIANIQGPATVGAINGSFPMPAANKTGSSFDVSNPMFVLGPGAPVSFLEQFRDLSIACPTTNANGNNPNVVVYNISGQEGAGTNNGTVQFYGDCGGYAGFAGAFYLSAPTSPNSTLAQINMAGGPTLAQSTEFYGIVADGRPVIGGASGAIREINNITIALKGGGTNSVPILLQGYRTSVGLSNAHFESLAGNESVYVTNGAHLTYYHVEGSTNGAPALRLTSTAGYSSGVGFCPQGTPQPPSERCFTTAQAIQDDTDVAGTASGLEPLIGYQAQWASGGSNSVVGNLTVTGACVGCGGVYTHSGATTTLSHTVTDTCTLGTNCSVTLAGAAVFTNSTSYQCTCTDATATNACRANQTSGSAVAFTGTGTDVIRYSCTGN